ncbi:MAG: hypothetical protein UT48_C0046G0006 [Parcubacteria group bacterium GW2011_GWE2_39_37]|uniref:Uncharacterized protein n=1 Tax=Candidatus Falkowbacteria bacterium GW2011_GWF2_39_8 TaxID=1618642 RepID=A0A0G0SGX9_9BACT|nr:MAG: hypothetical protein UT48_C0046G0006 [Parcubacteria group bacterium GW2011_GWE2_39_37]KKR33960.1 MAG: hypothetical protein UT64_C0001G0034 [Candidatus Falkowbacteria bacterium GW2011_GWF2_39_8]
MASIELKTKTPVVVESGGEKTFTAVIDGWQQPQGKKGGKPQLLFIVEEGKGSFRGNVLTVPPTREDKKLIIGISSSDPTITPLKIEVTVKKEEKPVKVSPTHVDIVSGGNVRLTSESPFKGFSPIYKIKDFGLGMGNINPSSGEYKAPDVVTERKEIVVIVLDQNYVGPEKNHGESTITLFPVEIRDRDFEADPNQPRIIRAGSGQTQLNIETHYDLSGLTNYTCKFTSSKTAGVVENGGKFTPPKIIGLATEVKIRATSSLDSTKKVEHRFIVAPPLCNKCGTEMANGKCPTCVATLTTGTDVVAILNRFKTQ